MEIEYIPFRDEYFEYLNDMIMSLYSEDPCSNDMDRGKIEKTVAFLEKNPSRGRIILFLASGLIIGYSIVVYFWSNEYGGNVLLLDELFIKKEYRGKGIGTGFLKYLITTESAECRAIFLEVIPTNVRAIEFYHRVGFKDHKNRFQRLLLKNRS